MKPYLYLLIALALGYKLLQSDKAGISAGDVNPLCSTVIFSTDWCPVCKRAKNYFEQKNYAYCEFDIEKDSIARQYYQQLDSRGVPTILIGNRVTVGFYPKKIDELIDDLAR